MVGDREPVVSKWAAYDPTERPGVLPVDLRIRAAEVDDCDAVAAIEASRDGSDPVPTRDRCTAEVTDPRRMLLVAVVEGTVVGLARAGRMRSPADARSDGGPDGWYLLGLIVADGWRRRGIGRAMTLQRLAWIAERADTAYYFTNARNHASIDLHRELGFVEIDPDFHGPGISFEGGRGVLCRLDLKGPG